MAGYRTHLKAALVQALKQTFTESFREPDFRGIHVSIEMPIEPQHFPGIWVDYDDSADLQISGVDHREYTLQDPVTGARREYTRWRFAGSAQFTVVALSSLERDRLYDELVSVLAFSRESTQAQNFRRYIQDNPLIAMNINFDQVSPRGNAAASGTSWGTDEVIYESTFAVELIGEFISSNVTGSLLPIKRIEISGVLTSVPLDAEEDILTATVTDRVDVPGPSDWH